MCLVFVWVAMCLPISMKSVGFFLDFAIIAADLTEIGSFHFPKINERPKYLKCGGMFKDMTTYYISERWKKYGTPEFEQSSRPKDTRGLGFTSQNYEERSGKKRSSKSKSSNGNVTTISNKNVTALDDVPCASGNKIVTEEIDPNFFIYKGEELIQYFRLCSNKNVTIL
jgi:hypothetical protein